MKKNSFLKRRSPLNQDMTLQITSMADIFMILLVFLLKSFSTGISTITPSSGVLLPEANASDEVKEALKLEISPDVILIDGKPVTHLTQFRLERTDVESDGTSRSLNQALIRVKGKREPADAATPPRLLLLADQKTPYSTISTVLASAGNNGFIDFKLVVVEVR